MTKNDLIENLCMATDFSKKESYDIVECLLALMKTTLENDENVKIAGFGSFVLKEKAPRRGRNPQTGEVIEIAAKKVLTFKPSLVLKGAINRTKPK